MSSEDMDVFGKKNSKTLVHRIYFIFRWSIVLVTVQILSLEENIFSLMINNKTMLHITF